MKFEILVEKIEEVSPKHPPCGGIRKSVLIKIPM